MAASGLGKSFRTGLLRQRNATDITISDCSEVNRLLVTELPDSTHTHTVSHTHTQTHAHALQLCSVAQGKRPANEQLWPILTCSMCICQQKMSRETTDLLCECGLFSSLIFKHSAYNCRPSIQTAVNVRC